MKNLPISKPNYSAFLRKRASKRFIVEEFISVLVLFFIEQTILSLILIDSFESLILQKPFSRGRLFTSCQLIPEILTIVPNNSDFLVLSCFKSAKLYFSLVYLKQKAGCFLLSIVESS